MAGCVVDSPSNDGRCSRQEAPLVTTVRSDVLSPNYSWMGVLATMLNSLLGLVAETASHPATLRVGRDDVVAGVAEDYFRVLGQPQYPLLAVGMVGKSAVPVPPPENSPRDAPFARHPYTYLRTLYTCPACARAVDIIP